MALKKQDLIDSLVKQGITLTGEETVDELKKLIADNAEHVDVPPADAPAPEDVVDEDEDTAGAVTIKYRDHVGQVVSRVFSKEVHGKDFKKLAAEFKATNASKIVKDVA